MKRVRFVILIALIISILIIVGLKGTVIVSSKAKTDNLLRLHVIANSNSLDDQRIKREVRDAIINKTSKLFIGVEKPSQAKAVVKDNLPYIKRIVKDQLRECNKNYNVKVRLGNFDFPTRSYGGTTLKAGKYQALQVTLGDGKGENWWCVLFPPLCFIDSMDELSKTDLQKLAANEDGIKENNIPVEFKFKFVEVIEENPELVKSKLQVVHILETSFPGLNKLFFPIEYNKQLEYNKQQD